MAVVATLAVLAMMASSCGGSGTKRLTRMQFVAKGDAVCAISDERLEKAFAEEFGAKGAPTPEQMQAVLRRVVPVTEATVARLRRLEPPKELEHRFDAALVDAGRGIAALRKGAASPEAAKALFADETDPFDKANKGFEAVGITRCSPGTGQTQR